ncbi:MAG TPA: peptidoglycan-binding protein [Opitutae bacterium]|nr:peptidoglycan-binding protein [Opitutae bacterium]
MGQQKEFLSILRAIKQPLSLQRAQKLQSNCQSPHTDCMQISRRQFTQSALLATASSTLLTPNLFGQHADRVYIVRNGDTLGHIALKHGLPTGALREANQLSGDLIRVGQKLNIPNTSNSNSVNTPTNYSSVYIVARGDTLGAIAIANGISVGELKRANQLNSDVIRIGQKLKVPQANYSASSTDLLSVARAETARIIVRTDNWKRIVVHHSAIKYGNAEIYGRAHEKRGMKNGLAYHFVIGNGIDSGDGEIEVGPRWKKQLLGGHVKSYQLNLTAIGICLVGNFQVNHPTKKQLSAFTQLMDWLRSDIVPGAKNFAGHRDLRGEQTICPGKNFPLAAMHARYD